MATPREPITWTNISICSILFAYGCVYLTPKLSEDTFRPLFLSTFVLVALARWFYMLYIWPRWYSELKHLPSPPDSLGFFTSVKFVIDEEAGTNHRKWINTVPNDGLIRYLVLGGLERVFLTSPKAISEAYVVRSYDYQRPPIAIDILSRLLGFGLLLAEGDEHKLQRKHLLPAFGHRHVLDLVPTFWSISAKMVRKVTAEVRETREHDTKGAVVPFGVWVNRATLDIIGAAGLGFDFGAVDDPNNELSQAYRTSFQIGVQEQCLQLASLFVSFRYLEWLPLKRNREVIHGRAVIQATSRRLIEQKQREIAAKGFSDHKDILSVALQSGNFTVDQLVDQVMTFLAAGHETTATASQWAMVVLSHHPEIQPRLRAEIRAHLPSPDKDVVVDSDKFEEMPYLRAFCQETLRFYGPVPFTQREAIRDTQILGHHIPKGTNIVMVPAAVNHSKELWGDDADQFRLERWLEPGKSTTGGGESAYANMTFGTGPRGCIGTSFARNEFHCLVAAIVGRFEVQLDPPDRKIELETSVVQKPKGGLPLRLKIVEGW